MIDWKYFFFVFEDQQFEAAFQRSKTLASSLKNILRQNGKFILV